MTLFELEVMMRKPQVEQVQQIQLEIPEEPFLIKETLDDDDPDRGVCIIDIM
jgi:hypothetical protein